MAFVVLHIVATFEEIECFRLHIIIRCVLSWLECVFFFQRGEIAIFRSIPTARQKSKQTSNRPLTANQPNQSIPVSQPHKRTSSLPRSIRKRRLLRAPPSSPHYCRQLWMTLTISFILFFFSFGEFRFFFYSIDRARTLINILPHSEKYEKGITNKTIRCLFFYRKSVCLCVLQRKAFHVKSNLILEKCPKILLMFTNEVQQSSILLTAFNYVCMYVHPHVHTYLCNAFCRFLFVWKCSAMKC